MFGAGRRFWLAAAAAAAVIALLARSPSSGGDAAAAGPQPLVLTASLDSEINSATSAYLSQAVDRAQSAHPAALVVLMNTPGGVSTAMDDMVTSLLNARAPTF